MRLMRAMLLLRLHLCPRLRMRHSPNILGSRLPPYENIASHLRLPLKVLRRPRHSHTPRLIVLWRPNHWHISPWLKLLPIMQINRLPLVEENPPPINPPMREMAELIPIIVADWIPVVRRDPVGWTPNRCENPIHEGSIPVAIVTPAPSGYRHRNCDNCRLRRRLGPKLTRGRRLLLFTRLEIIEPLVHNTVLIVHTPFVGFDTFKVFVHLQFVFIYCRHFIHEFIRES